MASTTSATHLSRLLPLPIPDPTNSPFFKFHHLNLSLTIFRKHFPPISAKTAEFQTPTSPATTTRVRTKRVFKSPARERIGNSAARDVEEDVSRKISSEKRYVKKMMDLETKVVSDDSISVRRSKDNNFGERGRKYKMGFVAGSKTLKNEGKKREAVKVILGKNGVAKTAAELREIEFRVALDSCSKRGDVMGGIELYDLATKEGLELSQYHYSVLLYLCSSAASGVVRPAKSGTSSRTLGLNAMSSSDNAASNGSCVTTGSVFFDEAKMQDSDENVILVSDEVNRHAVESGYELYRCMCEESVEINASSSTTMVRIAMSMGNGNKVLLRPYYFTKV